MDAGPLVKLPEPTMRKATSLNSRIIRLAGLTLAVVAALAPGISSHAAPTAPKPDVRAVDGAGLKKALAAQKGKAVLLNLWATWCDSCVAEFPDLVKISDAYRPKGLVVFAVSLDEPQDRGKVTDFILRQKAVFPVYIRSGGEIEAFVDPVDKSWSQVAPTTYLFNRSGKLAGKPLEGPQSYAKFEAAVKQALK